MSMARKDLRLTVEAGCARRADAGAGAGVGALLGEGIQRGEGHLDVAAGVRVPG
jgi:hypothetical protein